MIHAHSPRAQYHHGDGRELGEPQPGRHPALGTEAQVVPGERHGVDQYGHDSRRRRQRHGDRARCPLGRY
jgi:hypothetical protein